MIPSSELIINPDGTVFHLHIKDEHIADTVILVGDPERSDRIANRFDTKEFRVVNREFVTNTGTFNGKRLTVISTGIGCDNIDIVMTELDAAVNIDLATRTIKPQKRSLRIIRLGTSGALQNDIKIGDYIASEYSLGIDGLAHFYHDSPTIRKASIENSFAHHTHWPEAAARPYIIPNSPGLLALFDSFTKRGITISAGGFYAPQGRVVRLPLAIDNYLALIESFRYDDQRITNFEMEGSAIALLGHLLGHQTLTVCAIIAQRTAGESNPDYGEIVENLIAKALLLLSK